VIENEGINLGSECGIRLAFSLERRR
jgi:hypothetical protein